ncbi:hypothetical protein EON65_37005 [archaeon]|nr:MAG: hypothetical protein EON65_37005 [archaeon]
MRWNFLSLKPAIRQALVNAAETGADAAGYTISALGMISKSLSPFVLTLSLSLSACVMATCSSACTIPDIVSGNFLLA